MSHCLQSNIFTRYVNFEGGFMSYLRYLGWYAYIGVQPILFCICSSCLLYFVSFSGLFISACISSSCVYHILSVSLDCTYLIALHYSLTFICPVSCVPYIVSFSGLYISDCPSLFSNVYLSVSLDCTYLIALYYSLTFICQFLWIVHLIALHYSLTFICQFL